MKIIFPFSLLNFACVWASSNPQHNKHHLNLHLPIKCVLEGGTEVQVDQLTDEQLASIKTIQEQSEDCLKSLTPEQLAKMPTEFFDSAAQKEITKLPVPIQLATLKSKAGQDERFIRSLRSNDDAFLDIMNLAAYDANGNSVAMSLLFKQVEELHPELFAKFSAQHIPLIPAWAFASISSEQFVSIQPQAISAVSFDQFNALRPAAKMKMTPEQAEAFPKEALLAESLTRNLKADLQQLSLRNSKDFHPCSAVVMSKAFFTDAIMEILKTRCTWHIKNDASSIFSTQIMALMAIVSLLFIITL